MKLTNFKINEDLIALELKEIYLDLHNNYNFQACHQTSNEIDLSWSCVKGDWIPPEIPNKIIIRIEHFSYIDLRGNVSGSTNLDEIGFFENSTLGKVEYNGSNIPTKGHNLLLFRFIGGAEIAVIGEQATCLTQ